MAREARDMSSDALSDFDLYLFGEGRHERIYQKLGAHLSSRADPKSGTRFAVWAPNAERVSVVGPFNQWNGNQHVMQGRGSSGIWELLIPEVGEGCVYKYEIRSSGQLFLKSDPYGFGMQLRPENASIVTVVDGFQWSDERWMQSRSHNNPLRQPVNAYEVHLASWRRPWDQRTPPFMSWHEAELQLIPYVLDLGYTHIELMGVAEHPLDASWGYQVTGYYAPTARHGSPRDLMQFVDSCHRAGIGVILDWVPGHFPRDDNGLVRFDGTALYEHADSRMGEHKDWGTKIFNYGRHEVRNFLTANALYWLDYYHIDGLRVDAVASMLYLDYSRNPGEWLPNRYGGRENIEAVEFLRQMNNTVHRNFPGALTIAEESTSFAGVTRPPEHGGLGFNFKWNMGWMNDTLKYMELDPAYRRFNHQLVTFSFVYAWSENFILPISHDEVVHGKRSLISKMPGDNWQQRANFRLCLAYMCAHPGKKLMFMGSEFAQWQEWRENDQIDWFLLQEPAHRELRDCARELNQLYAKSPQLYGSDCDQDGFRWIDFHNTDESVWVFQRSCTAGDVGEPLICIFNATPVPRERYVIQVPVAGSFRKIFDSDEVRFGGSGYNLQTNWVADPVPRGAAELTLNLPPLAAMFLKGPLAEPVPLAKPVPLAGPR